MDEITESNISTSECNDALVSDTASEYLEARIKAYHALTLKYSLENQEWGENCQEKEVRKIVANLSRDIFSDDKDVSFQATGFLGCFLANEKLMDLLTENEEQEILDALLKLLENIKEKSILTRGLWSLAQSKFGCDIYKRNLLKILELVLSILDKSPSNIIIYETLQVLKSVMESVPVESLNVVDVWLPKTFGYLFHEDLKIRGVSYSCYNSCRGLNHSEETMAKLNVEIFPFLIDLKTVHCKKMLKYVGEECSFVLKIWRLLIMILGKDLHSGISLVNSFLEVVEKAFKSLNFDMRIDAFKCWHTLIANFSININILAHPKRLRLLIAPFKSSNAKTEEITLIKFATWWYFICQLKDKASDNFDSVIIPFFRFCFNPSTMSPSGANERLFRLSAAASPCRKYANLNVKTAEALARILSFGLDHKIKYIYSINGLTDMLITSSLFLKNYQIIFGCVEEALTSLDAANSKQYELGCLILQCVISHTVSVFQQFSGKKEYIDIIKDLFGTFSVIESHCQTGDSSSLFALKFLELTCNGDISLPQAVITSRLYHIPTGTKVRDLMNGTLSNFFIHKLCRPVLLHFATIEKDRFLQLWESILIKSKVSDRLVFLETVIEEMKDTINFLCPDHEDILINLWNITAKFLDSHIEETHVINLGDNQDHDWSCIYNILLFPILFSHEHLTTVNSKSYESMIKVWATLWKHFTLYAMHTKAVESNCEAEFIARKMLSVVVENLSMPPDVISVTIFLFSDVIAIIVDQFRFKELGRRSKKSLQSPLKPYKKPHLLHTLSGLIELLDWLMEKTIRMTSLHRNHSMLRLCFSASKIFSNIHNEKMAWSIITSFNETIHKALQINPTAKFNTEVERTFIEMWDSYCRLIENYIAPKLTKDQLIYITPLFYVALQSTHMGIRKRARKMWSTAFASTSYTIPDSLFEVLKGLGLPPASISDVIDDQSLSLSPKEKTLIAGTFLNRNDLPKSPFHIMKEKCKPNTVISKRKSPITHYQKPTNCKAFYLEDMNAEDFVRVDTLKSNKRVLTPRQAEKMKKRSCDIPALYNDTSSQPSQLPAEFMCYDSQDISPHSSSENETAVKRKSPTCLNFSKILQSDIKMPIRDSIAVLHSGNDLSPMAASNDKERSSNKGKKRKSEMPLKKSLADIRRSLKGTLTEKKKKSSLLDFCKPEANLDPETLSPLASPLKCSQSPENKIRRSFSSARSFIISEDVSEDEIPNSQNDYLSPGISLILTPNTLERPKRKRKSKYDDLFILTPSKKFKLSPNKINNDTISLDDSGIDTPQINSLVSNLAEDVTLCNPSVSNNEYESPGYIFHRSSVDNVTSKKTINNNSPQKIITESPLKDELGTILSLNTPTKNNKIMIDNANKCRNNLLTKSSDILETSFKNLSPINHSVSSLLSTPSKLSRSGRRIVAPNKDMPEPMTPPSGKNKACDTGSNLVDCLSASNDKKQLNDSKISIMENTDDKLPICQTTPRSSRKIRNANMRSRILSQKFNAEDLLSVDDSSVTEIEKNVSTEQRGIDADISCLKKESKLVKIEQLSCDNDKTNTVLVVGSNNDAANHHNLRREKYHRKGRSSKKLVEENTTVRRSQRTAKKIFATSGHLSSNDEQIKKKCNNVKELKSIKNDNTLVADSSLKCINNEAANDSKISSITFEKPIELPEERVFSFSRKSSDGKFVFLNSPTRSNIFIKSSSFSGCNTLKNRLNEKRYSWDTFRTLSSNDSSYSSFSKINFRVMNHNKLLQSSNKCHETLKQEEGSCVMQIKPLDTDQEKPVKSFMNKSSEVAGTIFTDNISSTATHPSPKKIFSKSILSNSDSKGPNNQILIVQSKNSVSSEKLSSLSQLTTSPLKIIHSSMKIFNYPLKIIKSPQKSIIIKESPAVQNRKSVTSSEDSIKKKLKSFEINIVPFSKEIAEKNNDSVISDNVSPNEIKIISSDKNKISYQMDHASSKKSMNISNRNIVYDKNALAHNIKFFSNDKTVTSDKKKLVSCDNEVISNDKADISDVRKVISNDKEVLSDDKEMISDDKEVILDDREIISDDKEVTSDDKEVISDEKDVTSDDKEVTSDDKEVTSDDKVVSLDDKEISLDDNEITLGHKEVSSGNKKVGSIDNEVTLIDKEITLDDKKVASDNKEVASDNKEVASEDKAVPSEDKELTSDEKGVTPDEKEITSDEKEVTSDEKEVTSDDKEVTSDDKEVTSDDKEFVPDSKEVVPDSKEVASGDEEVISIENDKNIKIIAEDRISSLNVFNTDLKRLDCITKKIKTNFIENVNFLVKDSVDEIECENEILTKKVANIVMKDINAIILKSHDGKCVSGEETISNTMMLPDVSCNQEDGYKIDSKLVLSVGTPERKKPSMKITSSRAAMIVACAKRTMKTRGDDSGTDYPIDIGLITPTSSPPYKKKKLADGVIQESAPWVRHVPSPLASPCGSILKRKVFGDNEMSPSSGITETGENSSPSLLKTRRVSFADPPVSESVEIPPSPKTVRGIRAQKKLDMTQANLLKHTECDTASQDEDLTEVKNCSQPFFTSLINSTDSIELLAPMLTSPFLVKSLIDLLKTCGYHTIGEFCSISEAELITLPVRTPKLASTVKCLNKYQETIEEKNITKMSKLLNKRSKERKLSAVSVDDIEPKSETEANSELMNIDAHPIAEVTQHILLQSKIMKVKLIKEFKSTVHYICYELQ